MKSVDRFWFSRIIGGSILVLGLAFYLFVRGNNVLLFLYDGPLNFMDLNSHVFFSLPSLIHCIGFILITYSIRSELLNRPLTISVLWTVINLIFEFCQKGSQINSILKNQSLVGNSSMGEFLNYGYFDWFDVLFILIGGLIAYTFLMYLESKNRNLIKHQSG